MDEFNLQRRIVRRLLKEKPGVQAGMESLLRDVIAAPNGDAWNAAAKINWTKGEAAFVKWFENLLKKHPIPRGTELLWFEAPSELNPARTSVSAYEKMGSADDSYGMEADRWWPITPDGYTLPAGLQDLPELERAFSAAGLKRDDFNDSQRRLFPAIYALSYAYVVLLVLNGLPKTSVLKRSEATGGVGVMVGWADGDFDRVGLLDQDGWSPFKVPKISQPPTSKELDPNSLSFNLDKYIKAGGNLEHRDKEHGATILMRSHFDDVKVIRKLLEAGADASAVDREGASVLHHFGACDIPILKLLLTAGAKANHRDQSGETVLDRVLDDGRCTVEHIELLRAAGAKPGKGRDPLMNLAGDGYIDRAVARKMIAYWIAQGYKINSRDRDGRTPLWIALQEHSLDWAWRSTKPLKEGESGGGGVYHHDQMAVLLLQHGADPNARLKSSDSPLIPKGATPLLVRRYDSDRLVKALLAHGADPTATCDKGRTALDYAQAAASDSKRPDRLGAARVVKVLERAMRAAERKA